MIEGGGVGLMLLMRRLDLLPLSSTQNELDENTTFLALFSSTPRSMRDPFKAERGVVGRED